MGLRVSCATISSTDPELLSIGGSWPNALTDSVRIQSSYSTGNQYLTPVTVNLILGEPQPGAYFGTLTINWGTGTIDVPVALYASASAISPSNLASVVNSASLTPAPLAPGELFTLTGTGLGAAPTGLTLDSTGKSPPPPTAPRSSSTASPLRSSTPRPAK